MPDKISLKTMLTNILQAIRVYANKHTSSYESFTSVQIQVFSVRFLIEQTMRHYLRKMRQ